MPFVKTEDEVKLYYEDWGEGNRYVFTSSIYIDYYCAYTRELANRGYHVIAVQMRGYGKSSRVPQTDDIATHWLPDLLAVADRLGVTRFAYTGVSHGSVLGWQMIRECPERILAFAGVVTGPNFKDDQVYSGSAARARDAARGATEESWRERCEESRRGILEHERPYMMEYWKEQLHRLADYEYEHSMGLDEQERKMHFGNGVDDGMKTEEELIAWMQTVRTPCILLGGMKDAIIRPEAMFRTARYVPHCKLVLYQDSDHGVTLCHGQDLLEEVDRFFQERCIFPQTEE